MDVDNLEVEERLSSSSDCVVGYKSQPAGKVRVYCFSCAGAGGELFRDFQTRAGGLLEFVPLNYPGHGGRRDKPMESVEAIVEDLFPLLFDPHTEGPYAFLGISMGSLVAYELARRIEAEGLTPPLALIVCSQAAPQDFPEAMHKEGFEEGQSESAYCSLLSRHRWFSTLPRDFIHKRKSTYKETFENIRADQAAERAYRLVGPVPNIPLVAMAEENDGELAVMMRGWSEATTGDFGMMVYRTGGHLFPCVETNLGGSDLFIKRLVSVLCALTAGQASLAKLAADKTNPLVERLSQKQEITLKLPGADTVAGFQEGPELARLLGEHHRFFVSFDRTKTSIPNLGILDRLSKYKHTLGDLAAGKVQGEVHLEGYTQCNGNMARVVVRVDLAKRAGTGHMIPLENPGGFSLGMAREGTAPAPPKGPPQTGGKKKKSGAAGSVARSPAGRAAKKATPKKSSTPDGASKKATMKATPARSASKRAAPSTGAPTTASSGRQTPKRTRRG